MPRKRAQDLTSQRNEIKRRYRRGRKTEKIITGLSELSEAEIAVKQETACFLKAADYSHSYIANALHLNKSVIKDWMGDDKLKARVVTIREDFLDGAVKLLRTYAIELIEMLVEIARSTEDDNVAIKAITEALDRMGMSKVNKSESVVAKSERTEVDIVDQSGLVEALKHASPEAQAAAAEHMESLMAIAAEHTDKDVTHA